MPPGEYGHQAYANAYANYNGYNDGEEEEEYPDDGVSGVHHRGGGGRAVPITALPIDGMELMKVMCVTRVQVESGDQRKWTCDRGENDGFGSWERGGVVLLCVCRG